LSALVSLIALGACAPRARDLVAARDYREAVCAWRAQQDDEQQAAIAQAIRHDLATSLHVHAVTREELAPVLGAATDELFERVVLLRVRASQNDSNLGAGMIEVELSPSRRLGSGLAFMATLTQETIPAATVVTNDTRTFEQRVRETLEPARIIAGTLWNAITLGLVPVDVSPSFGPGRVETYAVSPSEAEIARTAPRAVALANAGLTAWERPDPHTPARLHVRVAFTAGCRSDQAVLVDEADVALPATSSQEPDAGLEARIAARFPAFVRIEELARSRP
jgi:hypothetical protein